MTYTTDKYKGRWNELEDFYQFNENKKMKNGIGQLSWVNVKSALVYGLLALVLYVISTGSVFGLDWHVLVNTAVMGVLTSFAKNFFTTNEGNFAGVVKVVDEPDSK